MRLSLVSVGGTSASSCGYCAPPGERKKQAKSSHSFYLFTYVLDPGAYQTLIDAGWRRSGEVLYKPNNARTCCPQHPIRLPVHRFKASRSQRRALKPLFWAIHAPGGDAKPMKKRGDDNEPFELESFWTHTETDSPSHGTGTLDLPPSTNSWYRFPKKRKLEIILRAASVSEEKFQLYKLYQTTVHKEDAESTTPKAWSRFLVRNSFTTQEDVEAQGIVDLASPDPIPYGGYHQEWRLDGKLIAVGVLDILPFCVSSVYLYYDPAYEHLNLGKASALREILLVQQLQRKRSMEAIQYYYLGFYVHSCVKMAYKAAYRPQSILDTATGKWLPLEQVKAAIEAGVHHNFPSPGVNQSLRTENPVTQDRVSDKVTDDDNEDEAPFSLAIPEPLPPGYRPPASIAQADLDRAFVLFQSDEYGSRIARFKDAPEAADPEAVCKVRAGLSALAELSGLFAFVL